MVLLLLLTPLMTRPRDASGTMLLATTTMPMLVSPPPVTQPTRPQLPLLQSASRANGADTLVPRKLSDFDNANRRAHRDRHVQGTDEDVGVMPMDYLVCALVGWFRGCCRAG